MDSSIWILTALVAVTVVHHIYGGIKYNSPKRTEMAWVFIGLFVLTIGFYLLSAHAWARYAYYAIVLVGWVGMLGLFEGGYSHAVKVVLWLAHIKPARLQKLFPPEEYVLPNDFLFEATGILTFVLGIWTGIALLHG